MANSSAWDDERELQRLQTGGTQAAGPGCSACTGDAEGNSSDAAGSPSDAADSSSEEDEEYEVHSIVAHRAWRGTMQYRVRWCGYGAAHDTWEPASNLRGSSLLVSKYNAEQDIGSMVEEEQEDEGKDEETAKDDEADSDEDQDEETAEDDEADSDDSDGGDEEDDSKSEDTAESSDDDERDDERDESAHDGNEGQLKHIDLSNTHAKSLIGKWLSYLFYDTYAEVDEPVPMWYNCKVIGAGAPQKATKQKTSKTKRAAAWQDWVNAEFEDGQVMHLLVDPSKEGEVWRRGKSRAKKQPVGGGRPKKTASNRGSCTVSVDAAERELRQLMSKNAAADIEPVKNGFHPVYNPSADRRKSKAAACVDWEHVAETMSGEMSGRSLMRLWAAMQEREAPDLEAATIAALGLHPLGDATAAKGATLPLSCGEACIIRASHNTDDEKLLVDAANTSGVCPSCLRQLLIHAGSSQLLSWMLTRTYTPGKCLVCKRDVTKPHKPAQGKVSTKERNKSRPVINGDKIEHRFQWQGTRWKWYSGQVQSRAQWGGWFNVEFEDGETLAVNLTRKNEGSVWRHHSMPSLITLPSDPSASFIRAAIKAAPKAMEKRIEQVAEELKQRRLRCEAFIQLQSAGYSGTQSTVTLYPQLATGFSGNTASYWTPAEDKKLIQCIARHTPDSVAHSKRWGWKETSSIVGHSASSCRGRAELLGDWAAGFRTTIVQLDKESAGVDTKRIPSVEPPWNRFLDAKLCSAVAMRVIENDRPGTAGKGFIQGWDEIAQEIGKSLSACRHRLQYLFTIAAAGTPKEKFICKLCGVSYKNYRSLLLHNSCGTTKDCASKRGYWLCKSCCRCFHHKAAWVIHDRTCTGPSLASTESLISEQKQKSSKGRRLVGGRRSQTGASASNQPPPALRVVSSSFFSSEVVEKKMRKRTWQSSASEEPRLSKWPTSRIPIAVRDTQTLKGFGAFASRDIQTNEMLGEYAGEIIDAAELRKRQKSHDGAMAQQKPEPPPDMIKGMSAAAKAATVAGPAKRKRGDSALTDEELAARMTGRHYVFDLGCGLSVDASHVGNSTRYLNHASAGSDGANVRAQVTNHYGVRKVVFYAVRDIKASEELCYDYGEGFKRDCGIELI